MEDCSDRSIKILLRLLSSFFAFSWGSFAFGWCSFAFGWCSVAFSWSSVAFAFSWFFSVFTAIFSVHRLVFSCAGVGRSVSSATANQEQSNCECAES